MFEEKESRAAQPQSGNAAWKAAMRAHAFRKGFTNRRMCTAIARHSGKPCGKIAMQHANTCHCHGGYLFKAMAKRQEAKRNAEAKAKNSASRSAAGKYKRASVSKR
jgi:hypothetical protein